MSKFVNLQPIWEIATQFIFMIVCKKIFMILAISPLYCPQPQPSTSNCEFHPAKAANTKSQVKLGNNYIFIFRTPINNSIFIVFPGIVILLGESSAHNTSRWSYIYLVSLSLLSWKVANSEIPIFFMLLNSTFVFKKHFKNSLANVKHWMFQMFLKYSKWIPNNLNWWKYFN